ncbi:hypothetical protein BC831DRAFT_248046 [Entophlyctis helioformis]|nr:hypothetical protein BC831DRAFT_248046 [Entophlyctis helioformis]
MLLLCPAALAGRADARSCAACAASTALAMRLADGCSMAMTCRWLAAVGVVGDVGDSADRSLCRETATTHQRETTASQPASQPMTITTPARRTDGSHRATPGSASTASPSDRPSLLPRAVPLSAPLSAHAAHAPATAAHGATGPSRPSPDTAPQTQRPQPDLAGLVAHGPSSLRGMVRASTLDMTPQQILKRLCRVDDDLSAPAFKPTAATAATTTTTTTTTSAASRMGSRAVASHVKTPAGLGGSGGNGDDDDDDDVDEDVFGARRGLPPVQPFARFYQERAATMVAAAAKAKSSGLGSSGLGSATATGTAEPVGLRAGDRLGSSVASTATAAVPGEQRSAFHSHTLHSPLLPSNMSLSTIRSVSPTGFIGDESSPLLVGDTTEAAHDSRLAGAEPSVSLLANEQPPPLLDDNDDNDNDNGSDDDHAHNNESKRLAAAGLGHSTRGASKPTTRSPAVLQPQQVQAWSPATAATTATASTTTATPISDAQTRRFQAGRTPGRIERTDQHGTTGVADWESVVGRLEALANSMDLVTGHDDSDKVYLAMRRVIYEFKASVRTRIADEETISEIDGTDRTRTGHAHARRPKLYERIRGLESELQTVEAEKERLAQDAHDVRRQIEDEQSKINALEGQLQGLQGTEQQLRHTLATNEGAVGELAEAEREVRARLERERALRSRPVTVWAQLAAELMGLRANVSFLLLVFLAVLLAEVAALCVMTWRTREAHLQRVLAGGGSPTLGVEGGVLDMGGPWLVTLVEAGIAALHSLVSASLLPSSSVLADAAMPV